ncbi:hypothetical protein CYMTET_50353 [Cymbomonas tetramitiformis]|uniref:EF-hand domain-containing protein n=1 Tax=Cymbomonas tetramitiformis TaxID=36881 RepID=A0AAE0BNB4_9CHLO|nr:hypothetical protein CYMTET_50353 [Cymbomonas tetramitiformis]
MAKVIPTSPDSPGEKGTNGMSGANELSSFKEGTPNLHTPPSPSQSSQENKALAEHKALLNETIFAVVSKDWRFETWALVVIIFNACWIGVDVDYNPENNDESKVPSDVFVAVDNVFCVCFTSEIIIRLLAYKKAADFFKDPVLKYWNLFDLTLVLMMVVETWILGVAGGELDLSKLSTLRLMRLLRISRVFRMVPELGMMVKSMAAAIRSVSSTFVLIIGIMYVFGIIFTQWGKNSNKTPHDIDMEEYFGNIPSSFLTLMQILVFDDTFMIIRACMDDTPYIGWLCILFMIIGAFTILNMLIGVLCEVVADTTTTEKEKILRVKVNEEVAHMDEDGSGTISRKEFEGVGIPLLEKIGLSRESLESAFDIIDIDKSGDVHLHEFVTMLFKLYKPPESRDLVLIQKQLDCFENSLADKIDQVFEERTIMFAQLMSDDGGKDAQKPVLPLPAIGAPSGTKDEDSDMLPCNGEAAGTPIPGQTEGDDIWHGNHGGQADA